MTHPTPTNKEVVREKWRNKWLLEFIGITDELTVGDIDCNAIADWWLAKLDQEYKRGRESMNDCACKEKWTFGVVHLKDQPCYWPTMRCNCECQDCIMNNHCRKSNCC